MAAVYIVNLHRKSSIGMDFSVLQTALNVIAAEQNAGPEATPIKMSENRINFDSRQALSDAQKRKKESEMSHRTKMKRAKKVERSKGYFEKLAIKDKDKKKKDKKLNQKRPDKKKDKKA